MIKVTLEVIKVTLEVIKVTLKGIKVTLEVIKVTPEVIKVTPEVIKVTPEVIKVTPEVMKARHNGGGGISESQTPPSTKINEKNGRKYEARLKSINFLLFLIVSSG